MEKVSFEWDQEKDKLKKRKNKVFFIIARRAFLDHHRVIAKDLKHSEAENRYFCFGRVEGEILTVCFTHRNNVMRIISAGFWRKGKAAYEKENKIH